MKPWDWLTKGFQGVLGMMRVAISEGFLPSAENKLQVREYMDEISKLIGE